MNGYLGKAETALQKARQIFEIYPAPGAKVEAILSSGWLEMQRGSYRKSLDHLSQADQQCQKVNNEPLQAAIFMHLGEVCTELGRYQQSLHHLEKAHEKFQALNSPGRMAECELRLARSWLQLGQPEKSLSYLNRAEEHARQANHPGILPYLHYRRAATLFSQAKEIEGIAALQAGLAAAKSQKDATGTALCHRLTGEALSDANRPEEALAYLQAAESMFASMGLAMEQAACQAAWGRCYAQLGDREAARAAWERALDVSQDVMPDIAWQAHVGLAQLAEAAGDARMALQQYRLMMQTLIRLRQGLWQPTLIGSSLSRLSTALDRAVTFATQSASDSQMLNFIEASKASMAARQFHEAHPFPLTGASSETLNNLAAEVRWLQNKIRANLQDKRGWLRPPQERQMRQQLAEKIKEYDALRDRLERSISPTRSWTGTKFDLAQFHRLAWTNLDDDWAALDYYLADDQLHGVFLSSKDCVGWSTTIPGPARTALRLLNQSGSVGRHLQARDLRTLGRWLLPEWLRRRVTAVTTLIIAPHRQLHRLPWPALLLAGEQSLAAICIPVITPSLNGLAGLWQRPSPPRPAGHTGLILAVSDFQERHPALPQALIEADTLTADLAAGSQQLRQSAATWSNLCRLRQPEKRLSRFSYLHLASHAFHDPVNGRLSGLALYDRDVWLDELWDCAPLPSLVTLSACSGSQSRIYEGDEQVGLAATCLAAGAHSVIGSLWPVEDAGLPQFMQDFYAHLFSGCGAAHSLALAQRKAWQQGDDAARWGSFLCVGQP